MEAEKLGAILAGLADPILVVDTQRKIVFANKSFEDLFGIKLPDSLGRPLGSVISVFDQDEKLAEETYCPLRTDDYSGVLLRKKNLRIIGGNRESLVNLVVVKILEEGIGAVLSFDNITLEKEAQDLRVDLLSIAAHELRTPLTAIRGYAQAILLDTGQTLSSQQKQDLVRLIANTDTLSNLIDNLLSVSHLERGTFRLTLTPVDILEVLRATVSNLEKQAEVKKQSLTLEVVPSLPLVFADKYRLGQVLTNLVINAINYTQIGGKIVVAARLSEEGSVEVAVKDDGPGIPQEALPRLFSKFFRLGTPLEEGAKGTGLGLYICKSIIDLHKGKIGVESSPAKGSRFYFRLPSASGLELRDYKNQQKTDLWEGQAPGIIINKV